ncbi:CHAT domain-containing protein [Acrocarpospora phusangensis]|uniref:CHAT domain-containing protein n=1 Tax=Acrocarpospora phusangensis TaxID=1070424 RepID=A0A919QD60_9ACTN|nr:CHAT domain-containing protein [Acrocarpospora phusangensis]GIH26681.1 CHAT domain-containing protein [Acrocarpospora phusangensis]
MGDALREEAERLHARGTAATSAGNPALAARHLRRGLGLLAEDDPLAGRILISLAHAEAEQGHTTLGLNLLVTAEQRAAPADRPVVRAQRGLMLLRLGRTVAALRELDAAVPELARYDAVELARILLNRAVIHIDLGGIAQARDDLRRSAQLSRARRHEILTVKAMHNAGYCDLLVGDIPSCLAVFAEVEPAYRRLLPGLLPLLALDQARALLAAGLPGEAGRRLDETLPRFRRQRLIQDYAEAELARAHAALDAGDAAGAIAWARRAEARFRRRGSLPWALRAALMRLRAEFAQAGPARTAAGRASRLAGRLGELGLAEEAEFARLLAIRALLASGRTARARRAEWPRGDRNASLEVRLMRRLTSAELAQAEGRGGRALADLRAGLALVHSRRARLGSLDMRTGAAGLGLDLARAGLAAALGRGSPRMVFDWSERCRAQAFRHRPVRPPHDEASAECLAELRQLSQWIRTNPAQARREPRLRERCLELERSLREKAWQSPGERGEDALVPVRAVTEELAAAGLTMISLLNVDGRLLGLVVRDHRISLHPLGDYAPMAEAARRLAADLGVLAGRNRPRRIREVVEASARRQRALLGGTLLGPLLPALTGGVVIVPTGVLAGVPWSLCAELAGLPVVVAPSASAWVAAQRARRAPSPGGPPVLVAGPDLAYAEAEVRSVAAIHHGSRALVGADATVEATLAALGGAPLAHLAAHGHHEHENVLFSRLDLRDGPLMAYDLQRLERAPRQVVLSACDLGQAVVRSGDEILGFTAALLYLGTPTVISSVTPVPDEVAAEVMTGYHRAIARGVGPAAALAEAGRGRESAFLCFGAG